MTQYNPSALSGEMTLADLFAAYAPKKIPEWFQPQLPYQLVPKPETFVTFLIGREDRELFTMYYDSENSTWDENRIAQDQVTVPEATRKALADWKEAWDTYFEVDAKYKKDDPFATAYLGAHQNTRQIYHRPQPTYLAYAHLFQRQVQWPMLSLHLQHGEPL